MADKYIPAAETGMIYEFFETDGTVKNMVLVMQNPKRSEENLVSILMLGTKPGGGDTVPIYLSPHSINPNMVYFDTYYVHCGLITYCRRDRLGEMIEKVDSTTMDRIKKGILFQLGLLDDDNDYRKLYNELVDKLTKNV